MSPSNAPNHFPFPAAIGVENEIGIRVQEGTVWKDPIELVSTLHTLVPIDMRGTFQFMRNAGKLYPGSDTCPEITTPECATPTEATIYSRANELIIRGVAGMYLRGVEPDRREHISVRLQQRVVDSYGNRKGCHDNFGFEFGPALEYYAERPGDRDFPLSILEHLATRSFVTGAGYISGDGPVFAQKVGGLAQEAGYGNDGFMLRTSREEGGNRIEVRSSDVNISDWATKMRLGSTALVLAILQTPLKESLESLVDPGVSFVRRANRMNYIDTGKNNTLRFTDRIKEAVFFQRRIASIALNQLPYYTDVPRDYQWIARELAEYCDDFTEVINGNAPYTILADRADWANKFQGIERRIRRDSANGALRGWSDVTAEADDLIYDYEKLRYDPEKGARRVSLGTGFRRRADGKFRYTALDHSVSRARYDAPRLTRAAIRHMLLREYEVAEISWAVIMVGNKRKATIHMDSVSTAKLSDRLKDLLKYVDKKSAPRT